jgi:transposase InsO family protein
VQLTTLSKGKVEGLVGYARRNFMVPIPRVSSWEELNAHLEQQCRQRGHSETIGERFERDRAAMLSLPGAPYEACEKISVRVSSLSLVRYCSNDYSVPTCYGHREVLLKVYVHEVVIACGSEVIARHPRSYEREPVIFYPLHYLALLERKTRAVEKAGMRAAAAFLEALVEAVPYRIHTVLTDNGIQFADLLKDRQGPTARFRGHPFDRLCFVHGIEHRLTKPNHPWTNGQVERMNRTIKDATVKRYFYDTNYQLKAHLNDFVTAYNFARRLKTLKGLTPYEYLCKLLTQTPDRFTLNAIHQMPGLYSAPSGKFHGHVPVNIAQQNRPRRFGLPKGRA